MSHTETLQVGRQDRRSAVESRANNVGASALAGILTIATPTASVATTAPSPTQLAQRNVVEERVPLTRAQRLAEIRERYRRMPEAPWFRATYEGGAIGEVLLIEE